MTVKLPDRVHSELPHACVRGGFAGEVSSIELFERGVDVFGSNATRATIRSSASISTMLSNSMRNASDDLVAPIHGYD